MGCCCGTDRKEVFANLPKVMLENYNRWGMFSFVSRKENWLCVYDFQESHAQFIKPKFNINLAEYSFIYMYPLIFIAGGVDRNSQEVEKKVWATSPCEGAVEFNETTPMKFARRKPFLLSPVGGSIFAISGYFHYRYPNSILQSCERYYEGEKRWEEIPSLKNPPKAVFAVSEYIYAFNSFENRSSFERYYTDAQSSEWEEFAIKTSLEQINLTEGYFVTCTKEFPDLLYIFGGLDQKGNPSKTIYSLKVRSGILAEERKQLDEGIVSCGCSTDSINYSFHLGKNMKVYVFMKETEKWPLYKTIIKDKAADHDLDILF